MHKRRIMALARSGLCRLPSSQTELAALRAGHLPMMPKSLATLATARTLDLYRLPNRSLPTSSLLRLVGGPLSNSQVLLLGRDIWTRRCLSDLSEEGDAPTFQNAQIHHSIKAAIRMHAAFGYDQLSPVQDALLSKLPRLVEFGPPAPLDEMDATKDGRVLRVKPPTTDLLIQARTGSGKTLAYLVAAMQARFSHTQAMKEGFKRRMDSEKAMDLVRNRLNKVMGVLILVPNRAIAYDIARVATYLCSRSGMEVQLWVTDGDYSAQRTELHSKRPDIFIATPSRIVNGVQPRLVRLLKECPLVIYDEADAMMDTGRLNLINHIRDEMLPKDHQTWLVSATVPKTMRQELVDRLRPGYEEINTLEQDMQRENAVIPQYVTVAPTVDDVWPHLFHLLAQDALLHPTGGKAIVFAPTQAVARAAAGIAEVVARSMPWGEKMHVFLRTGVDVTTKEADQIYSMFSRCQGAYAVLFATDIASRGLDYQDVTRVIQLGVPESLEVYTHRIGRTSRAGKSGRADTLLFPWEVDCPHEEMFGEHQVERLSTDELRKEVEVLAWAAESKTEYDLKQHSADKVLDQREVKMGKDVALRLKRLDDEIRHRGLVAVATRWTNNSALAAKAFTGMLAHWKMMTGRIRRRYETVVKAIEAFGTDALSLPGDLKLHMRHEDRELIGLEPLPESALMEKKRQHAIDKVNKGLTPEGYAERRAQKKLEKKEKLIALAEAKRDRKTVDPPVPRFRATALGESEPDPWTYSYSGKEAKETQETRMMVRRAEKDRIERIKQEATLRADDYERTPRRLLRKQEKDIKRRGKPKDMTSRARPRDTGHRALVSSQLAPKFGRVHAR